MSDHKQIAVCCHCLTTNRVFWAVHVWTQIDCCVLSLSEQKKMMCAVTVWPQPDSCVRPQCEHNQTAVCCHNVTTTRQLCVVTVWLQTDCCVLSLRDYNQNAVYCQCVITTTVLFTVTVWPQPHCSLLSISPHNNPPQHVTIPSSVQQYPARLSDRKVLNPRCSYPSTGIGTW
jgi:hypothetical protein